MTFLNSFPSTFEPLVGLVFPTIAMASLFLYIQRNKISQIPHESICFSRLRT